MLDQRISRRTLLAGAVGTSALLALPGRGRRGPRGQEGHQPPALDPQDLRGADQQGHRGERPRWAQKHGASVTVEYFTFEDMQTKYVAAIENKNTPDVGQLETGAPARFAGMGQLLDLTSFAKPDRGRGGQGARQRGAGHHDRRQDLRDPVVHHGRRSGTSWRDVFEKGKVKLPGTFEEAKAAAAALTRPKDNFYGMGQSWNRTADGYGVMQSLMYSYGVGLGGQGRQVQVDQDAQDAAGHEVGDRHLQGQPPARRHADLDRLRQQRELHRQEHRARPPTAPASPSRMENAVAKATDAKEKKSARRRSPTTWPCRTRPGPDGRRMWAIAMSIGIFKNSKDPEAAMSLIAHLLSPEETVRGHEGLLRPVRARCWTRRARPPRTTSTRTRTTGRSAGPPSGSSPTGWPGPGHRGGGRGAGQQRAHRRARQGHRRQVVGGSGHRVGGQEDQGNLRHARG